MVTAEHCIKAFKSDILVFLIVLVLKMTVMALQLDLVLMVVFGKKSMSNLVISDSPDVAGFANLSTTGSM